MGYPGNDPILPHRDRSPLRAHFRQLANFGHRSGKAGRDTGRRPQRRRRLNSPAWRLAPHRSIPASTCGPTRTLNGPAISARFKSNSGSGPRTWLLRCGSVSCASSSWSCWAEDARGRNQATRVYFAFRRRGRLMATRGAGRSSRRCRSSDSSMPGSSGDAPPLAAAFRKGLNEAGYFEGQSVTVGYHWLEGQFDRLPALMADLVRRRVAVIATPAARLCFACSQSCDRRRPRSSSASVTTRSSLVWSPASARPGGRRASIFSATEYAAKRLALLHELVPKAARIGVLVNPANVPATESTLRSSPPGAARAMALEIQVLKASTTKSQIEAAFATLVRVGRTPCTSLVTCSSRADASNLRTLAASYRISRELSLS